MKKLLLFLLIGAVLIGGLLSTGVGQDAMRDALGIRGLLTVFGSTQYTAHAITATTTLNLPAGTLFLMSTATHIDSINPGVSGRVVFIETTTTDTLVDGKNLKLAGDFNGTADDVIQLVCINSVWYEVSRSAN